MPVLNSYSSSLFNLYRSNSLFNPVSKSKAVSPRFEYALEAVDEDSVREPGLSYQIDFLNLIFIAKLRTFVIKKRRGMVLEDINTQRHEEFVAKMGKLKMRVEPTRISFESNDEEELKQILKEIAMLIYSNYSNITLRIRCTNKTRQQALEKVLTEAQLEVENQKAKQNYQFFTTPYQNLTEYKYCEPSAPPFEFYDPSSAASVA
ncbi:MAG: hypothetical protein K0S11_971 [Gammaproteobacteria bacterium]|nr:hypothetical protein [Gammaproteobacteria bacterium]